ncbi:ATP-binding protein [Cellulomonas sp. ATA003]|uniref:ATP-binding protein n=1 Tax=Cellulomonas sp. ATA003 TaxID=3073064 RepID=UPI0028738E39|nr:ATP-binding protein [Cellulomonas sp. ATA003]WNB85387.1 ATP-binding protein [Cellulomonas sp. ATA003]
MLYRVAREALSNATAHAQPSVVTITARRTDVGFVLEVADDGVGFDPAAPRRDGHLGLQIVRDTVREAGGQVTVRSAPGAGTTVAASVPLT